VEEVMDFSLTERDLQPVDREAGFTRFRGWTLHDLLDRFASVRTSNLEGSIPASGR
jgi:hypothetical protein